MLSVNHTTDKIKTSVLDFLENYCFSYAMSQREWALLPLIEANSYLQSIIIPCYLPTLYFWLKNQRCWLHQLYVAVHHLYKKFFAKQKRTVDLHSFTFSSEIGINLEQVAQGGCGCPIPGGIQGQAGCGSGQPGLVVGNRTHRRGLKLDDHYGPFQPRSFYDSMKTHSFPFTDSFFRILLFSWVPTQKALVQWVYMSLGSHQCKRSAAQGHQIVSLDL